MSNQYITIKEAASLLGVSPLTLRNWDKNGKLKAVRHPLNNYRVYDKADLDQILEEIKTGSGYRKNKKREFKKVVIRSL